MTSSSTARLAARFTFAALVGISLIGGAASAASAAAAPSGGSSAQIATPVTLGPVTTRPTIDPLRPRLPDGPLVPVDPCTTRGDCPKPDPCQGVTPGSTERCPKPDPCKQLRTLPDSCKPDPCKVPSRTLPDPCKPDPCKPLPRTLVAQDCEPDPCAPRRGTPLPEGCRPEPCSVQGFEGDRLTRHEPGWRPQSDDCKPPKGCGGDDRCDRPVPGKPTFTG